MQHAQESRRTGAGGRKNEIRKGTRVQEDANPTNNDHGDGNNNISKHKQKKTKMTTTKTDGVVTGIKIVAHE